jgi:hypothetical protein
VQTAVRPSDTMGPANVARIVYFDYDSYAVKPEFQSLLESHARFLKANGARHVVVEATPTSAAGANTTWRWASAGPRRCGARWACWASTTTRSKP